MEREVGDSSSVRLVVLEELVGADIPHFDRAVGTCGRKFITSSYKCGQVNHKKGWDEIPIPSHVLSCEPHACRSDAGPIRVECHRVDEAGVVIIAPHNFLAGEVPDL